MAEQLATQNKALSLEADRLKKHLSEEKQTTKTLILSHEQELDQLKLEYQQ